MKQTFFAGGDWSGTPDRAVRAVDIYSFCVVAFLNLEALNAASQQTCLDLGIALETEFHGHEMSDAMIAAVLEMALGLEARFGILMVNKAAVPLAGALILPPPAKFAAWLALRLLRRFLALVPIGDLWCDEDIKGKAAQQEFTTSISHLNRELGLSLRIKTRLRDSQTSRLIQVADVYAYAMTRQAQNAKIEPVLENVLKKIRASERHLILGPLPWEE